MYRQVFSLYDYHVSCFSRMFTLLLWITVYDKYVPQLLSIHLSLLWINCLVYVMASCLCSRCICYRSHYHCHWCLTSCNIIGICCIFYMCVFAIVVILMHCDYLSWFLSVYTICSGYFLLSLVLLWIRITNLHHKAYYCLIVSINIHHCRESYHV